MEEMTPLFQLPNGVRIEDSLYEGDPAFDCCYEPHSGCGWAVLEQFIKVMRPAVNHPMHPAAFMRMGEDIAANGVKVIGYKHVSTRNYIWLDEAGHAYLPSDRGKVYVQDPMVAIQRCYQ